MKHRSTIPCLVLTACLLVAAGCGDDSTAPGGGGGGGGTTLSIAPGTYAASLDIVDCTTQDPIQSSQQPLVFCVDETVDDFMGIPCAIKRTGNALSISCDVTNEVYSGCSQTTRITGSGTASSTHYELSGTVEVSDNPLACADSIYCWAFDLTLDKTGGAPTACTYADVNTVELAVNTGPVAGAHTLNAFGGSSGGPGAYSFAFNANDGAPTPLAPGGASGGIPAEVVIGVQTPPLDPATLPVDLPVTIVQPGAAAPAPSTGGVTDALIYYWEQQNTYSFYAQSASSGTFRVEELDADHIAGTFTMTMDGTAYTNGTPSAATRTITGGYFVVGGGLNASASATSGFFERHLRDLLAGTR